VVYAPSGSSSHNNEEDRDSQPIEGPNLVATLRSWGRRLPASSAWRPNGSRRCDVCFPNRTLSRLPRSPVINWRTQQPPTPQFRHWRIFRSLVPASCRGSGLRCRRVVNRRGSCTDRLRKVLILPGKVGPRDATGSHAAPCGRTGPRADRQLWSAQRQQASVPSIVPRAELRHLPFRTMVRTVRPSPDGVRHLDDIHSKSHLRPHSGTSPPWSGAKPSTPWPSANAAL